MAINPSDLASFRDPSPSDVANLERQAQMMSQSSIAGYGTLPDPQLATEALLTGAAPTLSSAMASGDPSLQSAILSQPVGQSQFTKKGVSPPTALYNDPYQFDPQQYQGYVQQLDKSGINNSFKSMKEAPMANIGWYNSILNGSPDTIKRWQQFLADRGFYGSSDPNGNHFVKGEVNGYNTQQFQDAMKQWSLAYFLPQAILSRNTAEITNANQFLSALGFDPQSIASTMSYNPQQRQSMIDTWLQAQGPDGNKIDALNTFANHFGADALPQQLNDLRGDSALGSIGDFLHHVIPFIGSSDEDKLKKLTPAEQQILAPSLQNAHNGSGFLGFIGNVLSAPSKALVTAGYWLNDAVHGDVENPFDAGSKVRTQADTFVNNPMQVIFGQQFVKDHPWLATIGNIAVNIADDPLTWLPYAGEARLAEKLGAGAIEGADLATESGRAIAKAAGRKQMTRLEKATGGLLSHRVGTARMHYFGPRSVLQTLKDRDLAGLIAKGIDPIRASHEEVAKMFVNPNMTTGLAREILGDFEPESGDTIAKLLQMGKEGRAQDVLTFLRDHRNGYAHRLFDMGHVTNRRQYDQILKNFDRLGNRGKALHIWHTTHMTDVPNLVNHELPQDVVHGARDAAMAAGMDPKDIAEFETKYWESRDFERGDVFKAFTNKLREQLDKRFAKDGKKGTELIDGWRQQFRDGGFRQAGTPTIMYGAEKNPDLARGAGGVETSWRSHGYKFTKDVGNTTAADLNAHVKEVRSMMAGLEAHYQNTIDGIARSLHPDGELTDELRQQALQKPEMRVETALHRKRIDDLSKHLDDLKSKFGEGGGITEDMVPAPILPTQKYQWGNLPYTASEIMAYSNPLLRKSESIQHMLGVDKAMNFWKALVLSKPSTTLRVLLGDETSRFHTHFLLNDPKTAIAYMKHMATVHGKKLGRVADAMPKELGIDFFGLSHQGIDNHIPLFAGEAGYKEALTHLIKNHYGKTEGVHDWIAAVTAANKAGKDEVKAGTAALEKWLEGDSEQARVMRDSRESTVGGKPVPMSSAEIKQLAATMDHDIRSFTNYDFGDPNRMHIFNWIKTGTVDTKKLQKLERNLSYTPEGKYVLPSIQGRPPVHIDGTGRIGKAVDWYHHNVTQAWVTRARARGFMFKTQMEYNRLLKFYASDMKDLPEAAQQEWRDKLQKWAQSSASQWVKKNTYQGTRSAVGSELRSVAPFWGATANSNRFYLHTMIEHPEIAVPAAQGELAITQAQQSGGLRLHVPLAGQLLTKLHMAAGDSFTFEPFNALFLTREGFGGFVPGMGPIFNASVDALNFKLPGLVDGLSQLPGMQYAAGGSPMLPWLENLISGAGMATGMLPNGLEAPFIGRAPGYYKKLEDEKLQQEEAAWLQGGRKGPAPTVDTARADIGVNRMVTGAASFGAPIGLAAQDDKKAMIMDAEKVWDPNLSPADKEAFFKQFPDVADYFKFIDPHTPDQPINGQDSKNAILARSPWVEPYATGTGTSEVPGRATIADTQQQYKMDVQNGDIRTLDPVEYLTKVRQSEETAQAWDEFDRLQSTYQNFLQTSGVASNSKEAVAWRKSNYDPYIQALERAYPDWGATFVKQTSKSQAGLEFSSAPINSVMTFDVIPRNPALETKATVLWRAAKIRIQQAQSAMYQVLASKGSQQEKEMVMTGLQQQLDGLAQQDPTFASQLSHYRYSSVEDLITYNANNQLLQAEGYPTS